MLTHWHRWHNHKAGTCYGSSPVVLWSFGIEPTSKRGCHTKVPPPKTAGFCTCPQGQFCNTLLANAINVALESRIISRCVTCTYAQRIHHSPGPSQVIAQQKLLSVQERPPTGSC